MSNKAKFGLLLVLLVLRFGKTPYNYLQNTFFPDSADVEIENFIFSFVEPSELLKTEASELREHLKLPENGVYCLDVGYFYREFADIVARDEKHLLNNSADFVKFNSVALDLAFASKKVPGIGDLLEDFFSDVVELSPDSELKRAKVVEKLNCVAWCAIDAFKQYRASSGVYLLEDL